MPRQLAEDHLALVRGGVRSDLRDGVARLSAEQERLRNERERNQQAFQALDRNQNQLLQVLTSLAKTSAEQRQLSGKNLF